MPHRRPARPVTLWWLSPNASNLHLSLMMIRRVVTLTTWLALVGTGAAWAQERAATPLSLAEAVTRARAQHPDVAAARALEAGRAHDATVAKSGYLPRVDVSERWQRGDQPVYAFGTLLAQRRFTEANFAVEALIHPAPVSNHVAALAADQTLLDAGVRLGTARAALNTQLAALERADVEARVTVDVTRAYAAAVLAERAVIVSGSGVATATADRALVAARRDAGLASDADVLQMDLLVATAREREVTATSGLPVARATLNALMGAPLDEVYALSLPDEPPGTARARADTDGATERPDVAAARLRVRIADTDVQAARAALWPRVSASGGWEWNGNRLTQRAGTWVVGVSATVNVFRGFADSARLGGTRAALDAERHRLASRETSAALEVMTARAAVEAATARVIVAAQARALAAESHRILRNRYEAGIATASELLRAADSALEADTHHLEAEASVLDASASLTRALGR